MGRNSLLLHVCCAPCLTVVHRELEHSGKEVSGYFFNPNIHPWKEWKRRLDSLEEYAESLSMPLFTDETYPLEESVRLLLSTDNRCLTCFEWRLMKTAEKAMEMGMSSFSTTLSVSPYQDHDLILQAGERASAAFDVEFVYRDLREFYRESISISRDRELYRQPYCGCIFSERDRYLKT